MKQNIYDNPSFHEPYKAMRQTGAGLNEALEQPALRSLLPSVREKTILDLGCGFGHFARHAVSQGAVQVIGVDISTRMLAEAETQSNHPDIRFVNSAIEDYVHDGSPVHIVVSSLTLHYVRDYSLAVQMVFDCLSDDGLFVFSVEHPICTSLLTGWYEDADRHNLHWPVDHYRDESIRKGKWFIDGVVKYHRTMETYINTLLDHGFAIVRLLEPEAAPEFLADRPALAEERRRPPFLVIAARKHDAAEGA